MRRTYPGPKLTRPAALTLLLALLAALVGWPAPATAASGGPTPSGPLPSASGFQFAVQAYSSPGAPIRGSFDFDVAAGQTVTDRVEIVNPTTQPKPFYIYPAVAYNTEIGGGFALDLRKDPTSDAAGWITLPTSQYTVPAASAAILPVRISVPSDATPGDHTAGIVAEEILPAAPVKGGAALNPVHRVAARVYVRVEGPIHPELQIQKLTIKHGDPLLPFITGRGSTTVSFTLVNTGNIRAQLDSVSFKITGLFGRTVHQAVTVRPSPGTTASVNGLPDQILPKNQIVFTQRFNGLPPIDVLTAHIAVVGEDAVLGQSIRAARTKSFWVVPWLVLVVLVVLLLAYLWSRRRGRGGDEPAASPEATAPGDVSREVPVGS